LLELLGRRSSIIAQPVASRTIDKAPRANSGQGNGALTVDAACVSVSGAGLAVLGGFAVK